MRQKSPYDDFPKAGPGMSLAALSVLDERQRQIEQEGWTPEHDDQHDKGQLAEAASCYADASVYAGLYGQAPPNPSDDWPWDWCWWKPADRRRMLVKAGALILAEIERLDRVEALRAESAKLIGEMVSEGFLNARQPGIDA